jgi:hypothetical protein
MSNKQILKNMKNQKQQTTVDWIEQEILKGNSSLKEILEQAKEIEKEQIKDAYYNGTTDEIRTKEELLFEAEHFYNETYGGNK